MEAYPLGSAVVDHIGRRKLMLFASCSCVIGMLIAGGLLGPYGDQNKMRADAGISFICKSQFPTTDTASMS